MFQIWWECLLADLVAFTRLAIPSGLKLGEGYDVIQLSKHDHLGFQKFMVNWQSNTGH